MKKVQFLSTCILFSLFSNAQLKLVENISAALKCKDLACLQKTLIDKSFQNGRCDTLTTYTNDIEINCTYIAARFQQKNTGLSPQMEVRFFSSPKLLQITITTDNISRYNRFLNQFDKLKEKHTKEFSTINPDKSMDTDYKFPNNKKLFIHCNANGPEEKYIVRISITR